MKDFIKGNFLDIPTGPKPKEIDSENCQHDWKFCVDIVWPDWWKCKKCGKLVAADRMGPFSGKGP